MRDDLKSRRTVIAGVGAGGMAVMLAACGGDGEAVTSAAPQASAGSAAPSASASASASASGGAGGTAALTTKAEVPVGGGTIFKEQKVVVTQPVAGEFKCFSALCTHKGCPVASVGNGTIDCPCHGSKFSIEDGSVKDGPATKPLPEVAFKIDGESISLG
ncbi:Rieske (2Fe-2S) protein [Nonomuraea dietziae]|uniref:Cytochrome bc1 complex Rieske iron-sulfur subunit n=1 Tax=Nonomuraea dietziae TaxID=65515 RepID=A0A7W5VK98_9ACTN|nr:Rieske (2Fe-2S) protein [Nonomuraea dietziae]MBB3733603.1 Rieske Fe-S protein [Nonomuraea dietziae]